MYDFSYFWVIIIQLGGININDGTVVNDLTLFLCIVKPIYYNGLYNMFGIRGWCQEPGGASVVPAKVYA